ncbi:MULTISPECIES: class I SAM-dependent methyltransferase [unclassified Ketobacter]|uniref:class I SAM-dependent methyltransferase n=1 Tax=unclassified Ketobacter TaxID=2639109 RepID=UPI000F19B2C7|nr:MULTISPECIES: methyltransferase [unclassified Ketobacter]RLT87881.1 MAG: class I SAM-dependent methyltransferase [Ketobacter sp. GenoA1]RLT96455.1 MAG: class I SAM-dependent methyltransferase [Ketobacter sp.]
MTDPALDFICDALAESSGQRLLVADEHLDSSLLLSLKTLPDLSLLTNRYDVYRSAQDNNIPCIFNDMDISACNTRFDVIAYRVSKEKAVVHHIINQAPASLNAKGSLLLCGFKNEGIKTYISKVEQYLGCKAEVSKGERQLKLAQFRVTELGEPLDDREYRQLTCIGEQRNLALFSKPGQYGWNKIDKGSELLVNAFADHVNIAGAPATLLDLGCGYGYLSVMAWALGAGQIMATDNNAAAIASCRHNFEIHGIQGEVSADDCACDLHHQYDVVLCNPPFHKGFDTEPDLTEKFLRSARHHLKNNGVAFVVVNQFIPVEAIAPSYFKSIETVYRDKSFKVFKLSS